MVWSVVWYGVWYGMEYGMVWYGVGCMKIDNFAMFTTNIFFFILVV
jgi:hypothetical protein